jgi:23S rRNA pseudouridine2605 synthase
MSPRKAKPSSEPQASPRKKSPTNKKPTENEPPVADLQRINKVLAAAGLGSRRHVDELIEQGRVEIDGKVVTQVGIKVDMSTASISVDGELLKQYRPVYFAVHKPEGVLCTNRDPQGRLRVIDFVPNQFRLFPVGRLDAFSTGLIILTNDGELAQQLTHPKHEIPKRYSVIVAGQVELEALKRLERGIYLAEGKAQVDHAKLKKVRKSSTEIEITLSEGKNREIRRVLARLGHKVVSLKRIAIGPLKLSDLPEGAYRPLSNHEVQGLYQAVEEIRRERKAARKARKKLASASQESESTEQDSPRSRSPKANAPQGNKPQGNLPDRKSTKAPKERSRETLPSLAQNPFATEEDFDDDDRIDDQSQPDLGQTEPLILVRDLGPSRPSRKDSDEDFFFMPRRPAGTVIGQEQATESEGFEFELNDPDDDLFEDESFDPDDSQRPARGPKGKRPAGKAAKPRAGSPRAGNPRAGSRRSDGAGLADSQDTQDTRQGGPRQGGQRQGAPNRGRPSRPRSEADRTSRGGRDSTGSKFAGSKSGETDFRETRRSGPKRAGPKSGAPKRGGPRMGGPKSGGPKRGGPKSGGPKSGGPKRGGPKRGGGRGRSKS